MSTEYVAILEGYNADMDLKSARIDLAGNLSGEFSPADWDSILAKAEKDWRANGASSEAWSEVIRDFHRTRYWGFRADYRAPKVIKPKASNLGVSLIFVLFFTFTFSIMAVVWLGQIYTHSDDPSDKWWFFLALIAVGFGFVRFLWRNRGHRD
ncbi:MAG TPA: hypothetical protein PKC28_02245 [Bdellovibrionales bacterium]|nr:hypothetical protein [Bdellovibrionales bacterium]